MKLNLVKLSPSRFAAAHSLPEAVIAVLVLGTMLVSLYAGLTSGFAVVQLARENFRATQIMLQQMESIRLYTWSQLHDPNYLKPTFVEYFDRVTYSGSVSVSRPAHLPAEAVYSNDVRVVKVSLYWTNFNGDARIVRGRQLETLVARHGLQNYVLGR